MDSVGGSGRIQGGMVGGCGLRVVVEEISMMVGVRKWMVMGMVAVVGRWVVQREWV